MRESVCERLRNFTSTNQRLLKREPEHAMNGTPRLRSSFPSTPGSARQTPSLKEYPQDGPSTRSPLPTLPGTSPAATLSNAPVIPANLIDAPSQRMYALGIYGVLLVWRLYDWWTLIEEDTSSAALFIKWCFVDLVYTFGIPLLRIPWLEWSETTSTVACLVHAAMNGMLMFRMPVSCSSLGIHFYLLTVTQLPIEGWLIFFTRTLFDKELSVSENSVRVSNILHNSSLIMGRQIIKVLPEGYVWSNPQEISVKC